MPDASAIVYVRGGSANPALDPKGVSQDVWIVALDGSAPRRIGEGSSPAVSPRGDRIAFLHGGQIWWAPRRWQDPRRAGLPRARRVRPAGMVARRRAPRLRQRPRRSQPHRRVRRGRRRAALSRRFHGLRQLPGMVARRPRHRLYPHPQQRAAPAAAGQPRGRAVVHSHRLGGNRRGPRGVARAEGPGSVFREVTAANQLLWAEGGRLVFPWEADGWTHLYSVPAEGGQATLLTPGAFEVEDVRLAPDRREIVYSSNQGDIDRRHLWRVAAAGGRARRRDHGAGDRMLAGAFERRRRRRLPALRCAHFRCAPPFAWERRAAHMDAAAIPADFPADRHGDPATGDLPEPPTAWRSTASFFSRPRTPPRRAPAVVFFHGGPRRQMLLGWHYMEYYSNAYALNQYLANAGLRGALGEFPQRHRLRAGLPRGARLRRLRRERLQRREGRRPRTCDRAPSVDPARIGAWGGSYGGYPDGHGPGPRSSDIFRAGVDFHGVHDWAAELRIPPTEPDYKLAFDSSPMAFVKGWRSPVLLIAGRRRPRRSIQPDRNAGRRPAQAEGGSRGADFAGRSPRLPPASKLGNRLRSGCPVLECAPAVGSHFDFRAASNEAAPPPRYAIL